MTDMWLLNGFRGVGFELLHFKCRLIIMHYLGPRIVEGDVTKPQGCVGNVKNATRERRTAQSGKEQMINTER